MARKPKKSKEEKAEERKETLFRHGYHFKSKMEAEFADELEEELRDGNIAGWTYEPMTYDLTVNGHLVCRYTPDFLINHMKGKKAMDEIVEVKGYWRPDAKLRVKLFKALHSELKFSVVGTPMDRRRKV